MVLQLRRTGWAIMPLARASHSNNLRMRKNRILVFKCSPIFSRYYGTAPVSSTHTRTSVDRSPPIASLTSSRGKIVQIGHPADPDQAEPGWVWKDSINTYSRPLLGSELVMERIHVAGFGASEPCAGFSFDIKYTPDELIHTIHEALGRLRYKAPIIAASIQDQHDEPGRRVWIYKPSTSSRDVEAWIKDTLVVHHSAPSDEDFIATTIRTRMPYEGGRFPKVLMCHLLLRDSGVHSLFLHGSHTILDGTPLLRALAALFKSISDPDSEIAVKHLNWGTEWQSLPVGPIEATGGPQPNANLEVPKLMQAIENTVNRAKPSQSLRSQRHEIQCQGLSLRVHSVIAADKFSKLKAGVKTHGLTMSVLFEAAFIMAIFDKNATFGELDEDAHVILDFTMVALHRFLVHPHNERMASAMSFLPLVIDYKDIRQVSGSKNQLLMVMRRLKTQYSKWTSSPHLPYLSYQMIVPPNPNPQGITITNLGVIENQIPMQWPPDATEPVVRLRDFAFGHRLSRFHRPLIHTWTLRDELHVQIAASDVWDKDVLQDFLDKAIDLSYAIAED